MNRSRITAIGRSGAVPARSAFGLLLVPLLGLAGCDLDRLLDVQDTDVIVPENVEDPNTLPAVRAHAFAEFSVAYGANPQLGRTGEILNSGLLADEFIHTGTFDTREAIDRRIVVETNPHVQTAFLDLHRARAAAERAADLFSRHDPGSEHLAEMYNLAGFTYVMFGENYCSGVPFSRITPDGTIEYGEPETTTQTFNHAVDRFQTALGIAITPDQQNLARIGHARALLGLGQYEAAAAAAAAVPTGFEYVIFHSETSSRQNNGVWSFNNSAGRWSVADSEGGNGLPFRSDGNIEGEAFDPRVANVYVGAAQRTELRPAEHYAQLKYPDRSSSAVLANGIEARLIEAEAALRPGGAGLNDFLALHNELRATVGLPAFDAAEAALMTQRELEDLHFQERAYWLFLTARRLGDLRRLIWDYGRQQAELFPVGQHHRGGEYGTHTNFPIPLDEQNNPVAGECLQRDDHAGRQ
jgi:starch-binding outer membrane protein, SusD/RagB family